MRKLIQLVEDMELDSGRVTELFCEGKSVWKGLSDNLETVARKYNFIKYNNEKTNTFNEAFYKIEVSPVNGILNESRLPEDKSVDPEFGLPEDKKFPLYDEDHVRSAIKFFNYAPDGEKKEKLAKAIITKMDYYGISYDTVGDENKLKNYLPKKEEETVEENFKQVYREGKRAESYFDGKTKAILMAKAKRGEIVKNPSSENIKKAIDDAREEAGENFEKRAYAKLAAEKEAAKMHNLSQLEKKEDK